MQLFARCSESIVLEASARDTIAQLKQQLCDKRPEIGDATQLVFYSRGRVLHDASTVGRARLVSGSTLDVQHRLLGGGGDGGATGAESRSSYLEMYAGKKAAKVDPNEARLAKFTTCHLTGERLTPPCCCDELGNLFNKDAVVRALLSKSLPKALAHITGLKTLTNLILERTEGKSGENGKNGVKKAKSQSGFQAGNDAEYGCPITGVPLNGRYKFVVVRETGHVVSDKAIKEVPDAVRDHVGCDFKSQGLIIVNPEGEELDAVKQQVLLKMAATKAKKAAKRAAAGAATEGPTEGASAGPANGTAELANDVNKLKGGVYNTESAVFQSLFLDKRQKVEETYCCRANGARGQRMA